MEDKIETERIDPLATSSFLSALMSFNESGKLRLNDDEIGFPVWGFLHFFDVS